MDLNYLYTLSDPLTIVVIIICSIIVITVTAELCYYLRKIIPKTVECWFCKHKTEVEYAIRNCWICENCEQYNGFSRDGDYNKVIQRQYDANLNPVSLAYQDRRYTGKTKHKLCQECNFKQQLKIDNLAAYVPINEKHYDKEIDHFKEQLEKTHRLCNNCEHLLGKVLKNLREELSLPKKLTAAIHEIYIQSETAVYCNLFLSFALAFSSFSDKITFPVEHIFPLSEAFFDKFRYVPQYLWLNAILNNRIQLLIGSGVLVNSIAYCQTNAASMFLNSCSWVITFYLTAYPHEDYKDIVAHLKVAASVISIALSGLILLKNQERRNKKKTNYWKKISMKQKDVSSASSTYFPRYSPASSSFKSSPSWSRKISSTPPFEEVNNMPNNIDNDLSNLNLGLRSRKETKETSSKTVLTPPKFNPFSGTRSYSNLKNYQQLKPASMHSMFAPYSPPTPSPSLYDCYEPTDPYATVTAPYGCHQAYYPCTSPTMSYYFSSHQCPKVLSPSERFIPPLSQTNFKKIENSDEHSIVLSVLYKIPSTFLILCNLILLYVVYNQGNTVAQS